MRGLPLTALTVAAATLLGATPASATVFDDFRRNGSINPCNYTDGQLRQGLQSLPPDIQQYAPGLADQLSAGREGCGGGGQPSIAVPVPSAPGAPPASGPAAPAAKPRIQIPAPPSPRAAVRARLANIDTPTAPVTVAATGAQTPGWLLPLLVLLALAGLLVAAVRVGGWSPQRFTWPLRASLAEAGGRTADALAQLRDSVRLGR